MIKVESLNPNLYKKFDAYLLKNNSSLFYHTIKYKDFLKELLGCNEEYLLTIENSEIVGVFPLLYKEGKFGRIYNSLPFFGSIGGPLTYNNKALILLIEAYNERINNTKVASATVVSNPFLMQDLTSISYDLIDQRIGQFTKLHFGKDSKQAILKCIASSARRNIKKAIRSGVTVEINNRKNAIDFLKEIHYENIHAIGGKAKSEEFFQLFPHFFKPGLDYNIYTAKREGKFISALLLFYYSGIVEYFIPVTQIEYKTIQPMSLILYQAMIDAVKRGCILWNWGGTWFTQKGVYRFKKKWGAEETLYNYYIKINNDNLKKLSKKKISEEYDGFYIIPFKYLNRESENEQ